MNNKERQIDLQIAFSRKNIGIFVTLIAYMIIHIVMITRLDLLLMAKLLMYTRMNPSKSCLLIQENCMKKGL